MRSGERGGGVVNLHDRPDRRNQQRGKPKCAGYRYILFMITQRQSYKLPFILAIILHLAIFIFLFVKFALPSHYASDAANVNIIQAIAVTPSEYKAKQLSSQKPKSEMTKVVTQNTETKPVSDKMQQDLELKKLILKGASTD